MLQTALNLNNKWGPASITNSEGETIVSIGPEGGFTPTVDNLKEIYRESIHPADIEWDSYFGDPGTWSIELCRKSSRHGVLHIFF